MINNDKELEITKKQLKLFRRNLRGIKKNNDPLINVYKNTLKSEIDVLSSQIKEYKKIK